MHQHTRGCCVARSVGVVLLVFVLMACAGGPVRQASPEPSPEAPAIKVGPQVGLKAPELVGTDVMTKKPVILSSLVGQVVVLNFWATWCKPCEEEMPHLEIVHQESKGKVRVIAVGADAHEKPEQMAEFAKRLNLTFSVVDDKGAGADRYLIIGLPTSFFIDQTGIIRSKQVGQMTLSQIQRLVADAEEKGRK